MSSSEQKYVMVERAVAQRRYDDLTKQIGMLGSDSTEEMHRDHVALRAAIARSVEAEEFLRIADRLVGPEMAASLPQAKRVLVVPLEEKGEGDAD